MVGITIKMLILKLRKPWMLVVSNGHKVVCMFPKKIKTTLQPFIVLSMH